MTTQDTTGSEFVEVPVDSGHKLKTGAIGMVAVLFMAIANAAPITAMSATRRSRSATATAWPRPAASSSRPSC